MESYDNRGWRSLRLAVALGGALALAGCDSFFGTSSEEYLSRGVEYYQEGDLSSAAIEFRNALQENPDHARARFYLGITELNTGNFQGARRDLERAAELGYPRAELALPLTRARVALGAFDAALASEPVDGMSQAELAQWHYLRGRAALQTGADGRAEEEFRQALAADPGSADARYGQAVLARERGDSAAVRMWVARTLSVDDTHAGAWRTRAMIALQDGRRADAEEALDQAIANDSRPRAGDFLRRGLLRLERGNLEGARADAGTLVQRNAGAPWGPYLRGLVELREGDRDAAQTSMSEAISRTDEFAAPRLFLAGIHGEEGRYDQAEYQLDRYDTTTGGDAVSRLMRVALESEKGNSERARSLLQAYMEDNPADQRALALRNYLRGEDAGGEPGFVETAFSGVISGDEALPDGQQENGKQGASAPDEAYDPVLESINANNYGDALDRIEALLAEYPDDPELYNLKGGVHAATGDLQAAIEAFRSALQRDPDNVSAVRNLGQLFERGGREDVALALYRQAHENNPDALELTLGLARLEAGQGNNTRAEALVDDAIEHHPQEPRPRMLKARYALLTGDAEAALDTLASVQEAQGDNPAFMRLLGEAQLAGGDPAAAVESFQQARDLGAEGLELILLHARALLEAERAGEAADRLREAVAEYPEAQQPRVLLVRVLSATGDHEAAETAYRELRDQVGAEASVLLEGGRAALRAGNTDVALQRLREARQAQPGDAIVRELARAHVQAGAPEQALAVLEEWTDEQGADQTEAATLHLLAQMRERTGQGDPVAVYERLIQRNPDDVVALNNLAWNLREDNPQRALTLARRAREGAPESPDIRHTLAMALAGTGEVSDAITHLEGAVSEAGDNPHAMELDLAELYVRAERFEEARPLLQRLASADGFDRAARARELLDELP